VIDIALFASLPENPKCSKILKETMRGLKKKN
jgi:hypothetical protein